MPNETDYLNQVQIIQGWRGGVSLIRGYGWTIIRRLVWERDGYKCQHCGKSKSGDGVRIVAHHKEPYIFSRDNSLDKLITLCDSCHCKEEWKLQKQLDIRPPP